MSTQYATYSPEDNKLRLYIGRVSREEYQKLKSEGWATLHKQRETGGGDFSAVWTPARRDTAIEYSEDGIIYDEDQGPEERAADKAERFAGYRDKRTVEACGHADRYESTPSAHGFQSEARAERAAARHDRIGDRAGDAWSKAEYWTARTAGVISHALHLSSPSVRMGRIKTIEAEQRKEQSQRVDLETAFKFWQKIAEIEDPQEQREKAEILAGHFHCGFTMPRKEGDREDFSHSPTAYDVIRNSHPTLYAPRTIAEVIEQALKVYPRSLAYRDKWLNHHALRLAYENQMLEAQGGRAAHVEMVPGGWLGSRQIQKVNKSNATGRVVSVEVQDNFASSVNHWGNPYPEGVTKVLSHLIKTERLAADAYRAPTEEELAEFHAAKQAAKKEAPKVLFINPTPADALRLQELLNTQANKDDKGKNYPRQAGEIKETTQARFSGGPTDYKTTRVLHGVKLRFYSYGWRSVEAVVVLVDKPQKPLPASFWKEFAKTPEAVTA